MKTYMLDMQVQVSNRNENEKLPPCEKKWRLASNK